MEDVFFMKAKMQKDIIRAVHMSCLELCGQRTDVPFLTIKEGTSFRNCITKFGAVYPMVRRNLDNSAFRYYQNKMLEEMAEKDPSSKC